MTDRINAFVVVLENDLRADEADETVIALRQIKGVLSVEAHVGGINDVIAESRVRMDLVTKLMRITEEISGGR